MRTTCIYPFLLAGILFLGGCASQPVLIKQGSQPDTLEVCIDFAVKLDSDEKLAHLDAVNTFINNYNNQQMPHYKLLSCSKGESRAVTLIIQNTRYVPPGEQALYVLVSTAGIASLVNGGLGFAWAGFSTTSLGVKLSADIADTPNTVYRQFSSSPYFYELASVKIKHMNKFQSFMFGLFDELKQSGQIMSKPQVES